MTCSHGPYSLNVTQLNKPNRNGCTFIESKLNRNVSICITDLGSGAMICGVLFSISSVADHVMTPKFFHVAFFYSGLIIQLYTNCFYGSQVFVAV